VRIQQPPEERGELVRQLPVALVELLEQDVDVAHVHAEVGAQLRARGHAGRRQSREPKRVSVRVSGWRGGSRCS
jgi:hypothetical protein